MASGLGVGQGRMARGPWRRATASALLLLCSWPAMAGAKDDFPFDAFPRTTLAAIDARHESDSRAAVAAPNVKGVLAYDGTTPRALVHVTFLGQSEAIPYGRMRLLATHLVNVTKRDPASVYAREYLVEEAGKRYWLPVQTTIEDDFRKEVAVGTGVDLYMLDIGSVVTPDKVDVVLMVEEFQADEDAPAGEVK